MVSMDKQKRRPVKINGIMHKIGVHNLPMWLPNSEWVKSSKSVELIEKAQIARDLAISKIG